MERDFISIFIFALGTAGSIYIFKSIFDFVIKRNFSKLYGKEVLNAMKHAKIKGKAVNMEPANQK